MTFAPWGMRSGQARRTGSAAAGRSSARWTASTRLPVGERRPAARRPHVARPLGGGVTGQQVALPGKVHHGHRYVSWPPRATAGHGEHRPVLDDQPEPVQCHDHLVEVLQPARGSARLRHPLRLSRTEVPRSRGQPSPPAARLGLYRCRRGSGYARSREGRRGGSRGAHGGGVQHHAGDTQRCDRRPPPRPRAPRRVRRRRRHPPPRPPRAPGSPTAPTSELKGSLGPEEGAAGSTYAPLVLTNAGTRTCEVRGFPGVSYVAGADGHQVGPAAAMNGPRGERWCSSPARRRRPSCRW